MASITNFDETMTAGETVLAVVSPARGPDGFPTSATMARWTALGDIMIEVGINITEDTSTDDYKLMQFLGFDSHTPIATVGRITAEDFNEEIASMVISGSRPPLALRAKAKQLGTMARIAQGIEYSPAQLREWEEQKEHTALAHKRQLELLAATPTPVAAPSPTVTTPLTGRTVSFRLALQDRTDEALPMDAESYDAARKKYCEKMHTRSIPMDDEPTADQLALLRQLLKENSPPYVDFAVWGPYGGRVKKALAHKGLTFNAQSQLVPDEFRGPPSIEHWMACWRVFQTGMIMLDAADHPCLEAYARHTAKLALQFGPGAWATLYQAEVRLRREMLERVRDEELDNLKQAIDANGDYPFDPRRPWGTCLEAAVTKQRWLTYWMDTVTVPSIMIATTAGANHILGGDAEVASSSSSHLATAYTTDPVAPRISARGRGGGGGGRGDKRPTKEDQGGKAAKQQRTRDDKIHAVSNDGVYTTNRKGHPLCAGFQNGSCTGPLCSKGLAHQCDKCLDVRHGSSHPYPCRATPQAPKQEQPRGGGKKGGGKKGAGKRRW